MLVEFKSVTDMEMVKLSYAYMSFPYTDHKHLWDVSQWRSDQCECPQWCTHSLTLSTPTHIYNY